MHLLKFAAAALNQTPLDWAGNRKRILAAMEQARRDKVAILCLPELCVSGYGCEDAFLMPDVAEQAAKSLEEIAVESTDLVVAVGLPIHHNRANFNAVALLVNGQILGFTAKQNLAGDGVHYEPRWFKPWPKGVRSEVVFRGHRYPIGDLHYEVDGVRIGFEICEDAWVANRPGRDLAARGIDVILNPSASHFALGKHPIRERFILDGSRAFATTYVYANLLGCESGRLIFDGDCLIASEGRALAQAKRFSFEEMVFTSAVIDIATTRASQASVASYQPSVSGDPSCVVCPGYFMPTYKQAGGSVTPGASWEQSPQVREEEFTRAVGLGLWDYLRKSRSQGFVLSLSGGSDSSAVACLVAKMIELAVAELGLPCCKERLGYINGVAAAKNEAELTKLLLTCVYQKTRNSSAESLAAAKDLMFGLRATFLELEIDPLVDGYVAMVEAAGGQKLSWADHDLALQNIQARVRAPSVWLLANVKRALLLTTGDRSEIAAGYTTMDGDTAGGLAPIAGVDKTFLRQWLRWLEERGPHGGSSVPALTRATALAPSPELRPTTFGQRAEHDLMPYAVLDRLARALVHERYSPCETLLKVSAEFGDRYPQAQLATWIEQFYALWAQSQWKRERLAPSFHLDDFSVDPRTCFRFPILSGGFATEIAELRAAVAG